MADRFMRPPRQPVAVGTADRKRRPVISGEFRKFADLDRFSLDGGMRWNSRYIAWSPRQQVGPGTARPLTLSNAVPWVRSERDTFQSGQLLVGAWRRGMSN